MHSFASADTLLVVVLCVDMNLFKWHCHLKKHGLKTCLTCWYSSFLVFQSEFRYIKNSGSSYQKQASLCNGVVELKVSVPLYNLMRGKASVRRNRKRWHFVSVVEKVWPSERSQCAFRYPVLLCISPNTPISLLHLISTCLSWDGGCLTDSCCFYVPLNYLGTE